MKNKILLGQVIFVIAALSISNITYEKNERDCNQTFSSLFKSALADEEQNCPGGTCSYTQYVWFEKVWECTACCQLGQIPHCDNTGCSCNN
jgi:hypothetical protein